MAVDLAALPSPGARRLAVRVTKDALRHVRRGHPWVFDRSITSVSHEGAPGDLAVIFDDDRAFAAVGLWDPSSPMRVKVLHAGRPLPIDREFFRHRIEAALERRRVLLDRSDTDALRLVHGENDSLPGLVVDRYARVGVVKIYTDAWIPHLRSLAAVVAEAAGVDSLVVRFARSVSERPEHGLVEGATLYGPPVAEPVVFTENGLSFEAHPTTGQKTGHFLDQRDNRARVRDIAAGRRVLDVFSCTGGFSVHAAAGGAREVHSVDLSLHALDAARRNMTHNAGDPNVAAAHHVVHHGDAFATMGALTDRGERFDLVIVDPPSFAQRRAGVERALAAYARLTRLGLALCRPGAIFVQASCSSRVTSDAFFDLVLDTAAGQGRRLEVIDRTGHPLDHPIRFPEGAYLKALFTTVGR